MHEGLDYGLDVEKFASDTWQYIGDEDEVFEDLPIVRAASDEEDDEV